MKSSIKQISELTGFSPATVCNALNHKRGVRKETAEKITLAAMELGYFQESPITQIRFLIIRRNGLIIDNSPFFPAVIEGVERQATTMGYETILTNLRLNTPGYLNQLRDMLSESGTAVIVLATELMEEDYAPFCQAKCPLIILDSASDTHYFDCVQINNEDAAAAACNYLLKNGHTRIGYLRSSVRIKAFGQRAQGLKRALRAASLQLDPAHVFTLRTTTETAYRDMLALLSKRPAMPTAFFADDDAIALGSMRALQEAGYRIPDDISVIGFDNLPYGEISTPRLTTVHVYKQEMGEIAVRRLFDPHTEGQQRAKTKILVYTDFVERESVRNISSVNTK